MSEPKKRKRKRGGVKLEPRQNALYRRVTAYSSPPAGEIWVDCYYRGPAKTEGWVYIEIPTTEEIKPVRADTVRLKEQPKMENPPEGWG